MTPQTGVAAIDHPAATNADPSTAPSLLPGMWDAADLEGGWADMGLPSFAAFNNHVAPRTGAASTALKPPEAANVDAIGPSPQDGASTAEPPPGALLARPGAVPQA